MEDILFSIEDILENYRDYMTEEEKAQTEEFNMLVEKLINKEEI